MANIIILGGGIGGISPVAATPLPVGTPKTGYMIESMVTAVTGNIVAAMAGREPGQRGKWVHLAKIGFEKYFLRKVRNGQTEPAYEKLVLKLMGVDKLKASAP